jgi:[protein-PII] uridylyltransferase
VAPASAQIFVREDESASLYEVLVMTRDESGVFARMTHAFERMQYDILSARIYTTTNGYALDSFLLLPKSRTRPPQETVISVVKKELQIALATTEIAVPSRARSARQAKHFPLTPEVAIRHSRVAPYFELGITCADRPGLLSAIARALHQANINLHDARITTLGNRAEDVFIVEHPQLAEPAFAASLRDALVAAVA